MPLNRLRNESATTDRIRKNSGGKSGSLAILISTKTKAADKTPVRTKGATTAAEFHANIWPLKFIAKRNKMVAARHRKLPIYQKCYTTDDLAVHKSSLHQTHLDNQYA